MTDLTHLHDEVVEVTRDLIRFDTTNAREPGLGNETLCAEYLQDYLRRNGVESELVAREADRANIVARIAGSEPGRTPWRSSGTRTSSRATRATGSTRRSRRSSTTPDTSGVAAPST